MEDFFDIVENFANPQRELLKHLGKKYGLRNSEVGIFEDLYPVWKEAMKLRKDKDRLLRSVDMYFGEMRRIAGRDIGRLPGTRRVARRPNHEKYVIFSDHHMLHRGHRHDYFFTFGNRSLYMKVLEEYAKCDFNLVENGDVEEMLIMEPTQNMADNWAATIEGGEINETRLEAVRRVFRLDMLDRIINDNEVLYDHINTLFHSRGKYIRLTGNHDTYMENNLLRRLRDKYPKIQTFDVLGLHPMDMGRNMIGDADWLITHGHQFDTVTCPLVAPLIGELNSETLSWIYEGPDRKWDWNDDIRRWINGSETFFNRLASGHPRDAVDLAKDMVSSEDGKMKNAIATAIAELGMNHEIAWEYFERTNRWDALAQEVLTGNEFFKIRHLSEEDLCRDYNKEMWQARKEPKLVLGHTHEPRHNSLCSHNLQWKNYMNSGSAGRFQNLIFAVEIENGVGKIVSWHNEGGPSQNPNRIHRRVWTPKDDVFEVGQTHEWMCQNQYDSIDTSSLSQQEEWKPYELAPGNEWLDDHSGPFIPPK